MLQESPTIGITPKTLTIKGKQDCQDEVRWMGTQW